ncbi:hypothetical protein QVD17_24715 [Tagetes erecta]|uniref:ZF-HD dimerization-type domain-containing protein n=1 Tax=Tagetes erecta TaxID=13708 RepID=A0AAD8KFC1_TARER|nr:hypothetical protein QVD17_24715 [Tagetes erecta]
MDIPPTTTDDQIHPLPKQLPPPFTNGVLKRHKLRRHHTPPSPVVVTYKECLKNHAASIGGHAVDGCGEFMPSPASTPTDPTSIKCAACGCHRNFHRRDPDGSFPPVQHLIEYQPLHRHHPPPPPPQPISIAGVTETSLSPADSPSPPPISSSYYPSAPHMLLALSSGVSTTPEINQTNQIIQNRPIPISGGKKRFRTKFTQDQKQKMHELAERVEWKMQRKDNEDLINKICNEIGVEKGVFKVWMHNNKMTFGSKKDLGHQLVDSGSSGGVDNQNINHQQQHNNDSVGNVVETNDGSSSSS